MTWLKTRLRFKAVVRGHFCVCSCVRVCVLLYHPSLSPSHHLWQTVAEMAESVSGMAVIEANQRQINVNWCVMVGTSRNV